MSVACPTLAVTWGHATAVQARFLRAIPNATPVARVDVLVSWNFRHIVNLQRIHGYNSVNLRRGYPMIEIRTRGVV